jgi:hypothetical protein
VYEATRKAEADAKLPGNPPIDSRPGFPAARDMPVYIYSMGQDLVSDQGYNGNGGGDDINNWDNAAGWTEKY